MKKRICIKTEDSNLFEKIKLILDEDFVELFGADTIDSDFDILLFDCRNKEIEEKNGIIITSAENNEKYEKSGFLCLQYPFKYEDLRKVVSAEQKLPSPKLRTVKKERCVILGDETIYLTEIEFKLLDLIISAKGDFVSRKKILDEIWGKDVTSGIINVYIHYLRNKLEKNGRKIIISSRHDGYKIDKNYC